MKKIDFKVKKKPLIITISVILVIALIVGIFALIPAETIDRSILEANAPLKNEAVYEDEKKTIDISETFTEVDGFAEVGKVGDLKLFYNQEDYTIKVQNTKTGYEWNSFVTEEDYTYNGNAEKLTNAMAKNMKPLFDVGYTDFGPITKDTSLIKDPDAEVDYYKLKNGIALNAKFSIGITVRFELWLDENGLNARVPVDKIKEEAVSETEKYGITKVTILPYLGAVADTVEDSFVLFPDTNGGVYEIKNTDTKKSVLSTDIYFPRDLSLDNIEQSNRLGKKNALLPYFGVAKKQNGFVGYITEGEMNSYVTISPSGYKRIEVTRVAPSVSLRKSYTYKNPAGEDITETEKNISAANFSVHYSFANETQEGKNVSYGDLAKVLQKFLVDSKRLVKSEVSKSEGVKVNLQMLMTTEVDSMVAQFLQAMTTCDDIKELVDGFDEKDRSDLRIMLLGWQSSGYNINPSSGKVAGNIGDLAELCEYLKKNGVENYAVEDLIAATTDSSYFSKQNDAVYNETNLPVTNSNGDQYIRNVYKGYVMLRDDEIPYLNDYGVGGVALDKAGWYVFDDYQKNFETTRYDTISAYNAMFKAVRDAGMKVATQRGNGYILNSVDYIYDVPSCGSSFELLDKEVPFYQMVVHGYIPYSLDTPGNMSVEYEKEILKWIEYGAEPMFLLTKEMSEEFKDSTVENAFSTEVENWLDKVKEVRKLFNTELAFTGNQTMVEHEVLAENVVCVTYSGGNKIYINYNEEKALVDGISVEAKDFTVVKAK